MVRRFLCACDCISNDIDSTLVVFIADNASGNFYFLIHGDKFCSITIFCSNRQTHIFMKIIAIYSRNCYYFNFTIQIVIFTINCNNFIRKCARSTFTIKNSIFYYRSTNIL